MMQGLSVAANGKNYQSQTLNTSGMDGTTLPQTESQWIHSIESFCHHPGMFNPASRITWLGHLRNFVEEQTQLSPATVNQLVTFSLFLCDWALVLKLEKKFVIQTCNGRQDLAYAMWKLGHWSEAYHLLECLMFQQPDKDQCYGLYNELLNSAHQQGFSRYHNPAISAFLSLEPLNFHHGQEFLWQYHDPRIAELCCLPYLDNLTDWNHWQSDQGLYDDQTTLAVWHRDWGFIGVVSLAIHDDVGFFYYWMGNDFQNQGLGTQAASLLLDMGKECFGLRCCYAKVYEHNLSSQKAMEKIGFSRLPFNTAEPDNLEYLYYYGPVCSAEDNLREIYLLFQKMQSTTVLDVPLSWQMELGYQ